MSINTRIMLEMQHFSLAFYYGIIISVSKKLGISKKADFLKDGLAKYDISAR